MSHVEEPSMVPADEPLTCPTCGAPIRADDAFCESCGATLQPGAQAAPPGALTLPPATVGSGDQTQPTDTTASTAPVSPLPAICPACGGEIIDDGFCGTCGRKALSERDHWEEHPSPWIGGVCDKGILHARNEDAMALASTADRSFGVIVVCDGVTTAPDSDRAALAAARAACAAILAIGAADEHASTAAIIDQRSDSLVGATAEANAAAVGVAHALGNPPEPPSCTFVAAVVGTAMVTVAWCGDSRAYWLPDSGEGVQLTTDHSLGTEMIRSGMSQRDAEADPTSHTITRWLGADSVDPTPEVVSHPLDTPGWVLVCSDGLWNYASTPTALSTLVAEFVAAGRDTPVSLGGALVEWANAQGGHDNITAALARADPSLA